MTNQLVSSKLCMQALRKKFREKGYKQVQFWMPGTIYDEICKGTWRSSGKHQYVGDELLEAYKPTGAATRFFQGLPEEMKAEIRAIEGYQMGSDFQVLVSILNAGLRWHRGYKNGEIQSPLTVNHRDAKPKASTARARASRPAQKGGGDK